MPPSLTEVLDDEHERDRWSPPRTRIAEAALGVLEPDAVTTRPTAPMCATRTRACGPFTEADAQRLLRPGRAHRAARREAERGRTAGAVPRRRRSERRREVLGRAGRARAGDPERRARGPEAGLRHRDVPRRPPDRRARGRARSGSRSARPTRLQDLLGAGSRGLLEAVDLVAPAGCELVLVVDQFEELFTLTTDERERELFLESLRVATADPESRLRVDRHAAGRLLRPAAHLPRFGELLAARTEAVPPLTPDELEQAIRGPAERVGVAPEPGSRRGDDRRRRPPARRAPAPAVRAHRAVRAP